MNTPDLFERFTDSLFDNHPLSLSNCDARPLPMSCEEVRLRGFSQVDVVFITGDAYVDHPSFAMALLGRLLESAGYRVAILSQPDWRGVKPFRAFGRPRLFFAVSAGNMDSMINRFTANKKVRNDDAYSAGGRIGKRPDRATLAYCQRAREAYPGVVVVAGGVEASLRRVSHYDYWSDTVRRSIVLDSKMDLLVFGMGERSILEIARGLSAGISVKELRDIRGVAYRTGASERNSRGGETVELPSHEQVAGDPMAFAKMTRLLHRETNPLNARRLVQSCSGELVVVNPAARPLTEAEMDWIYGLPYTRRPHPSYKRQNVPAYEVVKASVQISRGCFGGCAFCSIAAHEGRIVQNRSRESILSELRRLTSDPLFSGIVSDLGGPTANMYRMGCTRPQVARTCRRLSCLHPTVCALLNTDHKPLIEIMRAARALPGIRKVLVASGIRMDLALRDLNYIRELAAHHVGGRLKVAPEHTDAQVLRLMKKPRIECFLEFAREFKKASARAHQEQYLEPYFIASHPGSDLNAMIDLAVFLKTNGYRPDRVQDFIPSPFDIATCMYHTGYEPIQMRAVKSAKTPREREMQRALLHFFKPENWTRVRAALVKAGRTDLIGSGPACLIPRRPPREVKTASNKERESPLANRTAPYPERNQKQPGYRPGRKTAKRRPPISKKDTGLS